MDKSQKCKDSWTKPKIEKIMDKKPKMEKFMDKYKHPVSICMYSKVRQ